MTREFFVLQRENAERWLVDYVIVDNPEVVYGLIYGRPDQPEIFYDLVCGPFPNRDMAESKVREFREKAKRNGYFGAGWEK